MLVQKTNARINFNLRAQSLHAKYRKCTNLSSNFPWLEQDMWMYKLNDCTNLHSRCRATMSISNASRWHAVSWKPPDTYTAIKNLHAESGQKRWYFVIPVSSFVVRCTRVAVSVYAAFSPSWLATLLQTSKQRTRRNWALCKDVHFLTNGLWYGYLVLLVRFHNMPVLSRVRSGRSWYPASRSNWPSATYWFHIHMTTDGCWQVRRAISWNDNPNSV